MVTPRNPLQFKTQAISQVTGMGGEVVELNIEELEERIAPGCKPVTR